MNNSVTPGAVEVKKCRGKWTAALVAEYSSTTELVKKSEDNGPDAAHTTFCEDGITYKEDASEKADENITSALATRANNEMGVTTNAMDTPLVAKVKNRDATRYMDVA